MTLQARRDDRGAGLIGTIGGVTVVLAFLLFSVQLLIGLYARSTVTAVAHDAAQRAAGRGAGRSAAALDAYAGDAERSLAGVNGRVDFDESEDLDGDGEVDLIVLHVVAEAPRFIPPFLGDDLGVSDIEQRVRLRVEEFQDGTAS